MYKFGLQIGYQILERRSTVFLLQNYNFRLDTLIVEITKDLDWN